MSRREAAKILGTSYENVKRMQRAYLLVSGVRDQRGHQWLDRQEVDALARQRSARVETARPREALKLATTSKREPPK